jgi:putative ABC transport system permease protein
VKEAVWRVDKDQPLYRIRTMEEVVADARVAARLTVILLCVFAALALLMAAIGVYGVMSNAVGQRRQEIGLRMAVGASSADVFRMVLGRSLLLASAGVALGLAMSAALSGLLGSLLYGVSSTDPLVFLGVALVLVCVAAVASCVPARRATRVDPVVTLRCQ